MKNLLVFLIILGNLCLNSKAQTPGSKDNILEVLQYQMIIKLLLLDIT